MSLRQWIKAGAAIGNLKKPGDWARALVDGNLFITLFEQGPHGKLVGEDINGNRYYENNDLPYDRKRWVVYKERTPPYKPNPTSIPPEWHGWINYINDFEPNNHKFTKPVYALPSCPPSPTGSAVGGYYQPKGAWANPRQLKWKRYSAWRPSEGAAAAGK